MEDPSRVRKAFDAANDFLNPVLNRGMRPELVN
jgi:hypothetical protein